MGGGLMAYEPNYNIPSGATPVKTDPVPITIKGKTIPGYQTTFSDGTSKWIYQGDIGLSSNFDYSSLTGQKKSDGTWTWEGTTPNSISNLASRENLTEQQIKDELYKTPQVQNALNGKRVLQLGGIQAAQKLDPTIPQSSGVSVNPSGPSSQGGTVAPEDYSPKTLEPTSTNEQLGPQLGPIAPGDGLRYPEDIGSSTQDRIKFQALRIKPRTTTFSGLNFTLPSRGTENPYEKNGEGPVFIAIQAPISDQNSVDWGPDTLNAVDAAIFNLSYGVMTSGNANSQFQQTYQGLLDTAGNNLSRFQRYFAGQAASINNILSRTDNIVLNPNLELLFTGPQLRPFTFQFKMSARSSSEAGIIKNIIKYFKYHMAVRKETDGLFLRAPHVFSIQYQYKTKDSKGNVIEPPNHPGINLIKTCALTNFSVDYTPLGSYTTFTDGTMVAYTLNMQFQELEPVYDQDYVSNKDHPIGF